MAEDDRTDDRKVPHPLRQDRVEAVAGRRVREVEVVSEVGREARRAGEDGQREPGDDLARPQRHDEEGVDRRHRRAGERGDAEGSSEHDGRRDMEALHRPEAHHRADEHHPLDAEVEHARALGQDLAERRVQKRRAVHDGRGEHDDDDRVVHAASTVAAGARPMRIR